MRRDVSSSRETARPDSDWSLQPQPSGRKEKSYVFSQILQSHSGPNSTAPYTGSCAPSGQFRHVAPFVRGQSGLDSFPSGFCYSRSAYSFHLPPGQREYPVWHKRRKRRKRGSTLHRPGIRALNQHHHEVPMTPPLETSP